MPAACPIRRELPGTHPGDNGATDAPARVRDLPDHLPSTYALFRTVTPGADHQPGWSCPVAVSVTDAVHQSRDSHRSRVVWCTSRTTASSGHRAIVERLRAGPHVREEPSR